MTNDITWEPPGPGTWERDLSHVPPAPTPVFRRVMQTAIPAGYTEVFDRFGAPLKTMDLRMVRNGMYRRLVPLVGGDRGGPPPPAPILWLAARLHPAFRAANKKALRLFEEKNHLDVLSSWETTERFEWIEKNRALQSEDLSTYDDAQLADHVERTDAHLIAGNIRHHVLHGTDMGPIGDLLVHTTRWGLDPIEVMGLLKGSSPATREAAEMGAAIAAAVRDGGGDVDALTSVDDIRAAGPAAGAALDEYLDLYGWRLVSSYDIEGLTLNELPGSILSVVKANAGGADHFDPTVRESEARLRATVPDDARADFDELLDTARRAYGLRDDNGPLTAEWPFGLVRRAFLEAGRRLDASGRVSEAARVFELDADELAAVLRGADEPDAAAIDDRAAHRQWEATLDPPMILGDPPAEPDASLLPRGLRRMTETIVACVSMLEKEDGGRPLEGMGIGSAPYTGRARLASRPEDVLATFEPGDILVAAWTAPTYNAVIASAGAMIVEEGGLLCHAAVMARELGVPAVIGAGGALSLIEEGATVTVDPVAGKVTVDG